MPTARFLSLPYMALSPRVRIGMEARVRHLRRPDPKEGLSPRLLDIGSANGAFLLEMGAAGWQAQGLEPDAEAVRVARKAGLSVEQGLLTGTTFPEGAFDAVTMSHVIEHLHDPHKTLRLCRRILRPGGVLWIATPNLLGTAHAHFGPDWIGLDPPRHLILFSPEALKNAVRQAGFTVSDDSFRRTLRARFHFRASAAIAKGVSPAGDLPRLSPEQKRAAHRSDLRAWLRPDRGDDMILVARRDA